MLHKRPLIALTLALAAAWGANASAGELVVSAAASLTNAFKDVAQGFEKEHPGTKVILNFGASDVLLQQIVKGAPADVFASADQKAMDKAVEEKAAAEVKAETPVVEKAIDQPAPGIELPTDGSDVILGVDQVSWADIPHPSIVVTHFHHPNRFRQGMQGVLVLLTRNQHCQRLIPTNLRSDFAENFLSWFGSLPPVIRAFRPHHVGLLVLMPFRGHIVFILLWSCLFDLHYLPRYFLAQS